MKFPNYKQLLNYMCMTITCLAEISVLNEIALYTLLLQSMFLKQNH